MESPEEREVPDVIASDTNNATQIHPKDAPPEKQGKFKCFKAYNTGMWNGPKRENTENFRRQDNLHRYDSIASTLSLSGYQKSRGRKLLEEINLMKMGIKVDFVIFGICTLVANSDVDNGSRYYPNTDSSDDEIFSEFADSIDLPEPRQISVIEKVRSELNL